MADEASRRDGGERSDDSDRFEGRDRFDDDVRFGDGAAADGDPWDEAVLDEDFVRAAETTEPSARARMLSARWRAEEPEPQPWRSDEPPAGWFFSKRRRRWRRR